MSELKIAIDLGSDRFKGIVGHIKDGKIEVLSAVSVPSQDSYENGKLVIVNTAIECLSELLQQLYNEANKYGNINFNAALFSISGPNVLVDQIDFSHLKTSLNPEVRPEDIEKLFVETLRSIKKRPGHEHLHLIPKNYTVDGAKIDKDPKGRLCRTLGVQAFYVSAQTEDLEILRNVVGKARFISKDGFSKGIEIEQMIYAPLAAVLGGTTHANRKDGVAFVHVGHNFTEVSILQQQNLTYHALIPMGGQHVIKDLQHFCSTRDIYAKSIFEEHVSISSNYVENNTFLETPEDVNMPSAQISLYNACKVVESRLLSIFSFVASEIDYSKEKAKLLSGIIFSGGLANVDGAADLLERTAKLKVRFADVSKVPNREDAQLPQFATALGMLLWQEASFDMLQEEDTNVTSGQIPNTTTKKTLLEKIKLMINPDLGDDTL